MFMLHCNTYNVWFYSDVQAVKSQIINVLINISFICFRFHAYNF